MTWGAGFAWDRVIDDSPYRLHSLSIVRREGYTQPEVHQVKREIDVVIEDQASKGMKLSCVVVGLDGCATGPGVADTGFALADTHDDFCALGWQGARDPPDAFRARSVGATPGGR